jgi:hypothetical protein
MARLVMASVDETSRIPHINVISPTLKGGDGDDVLAGVKPTMSWCYLQNPCPFHRVCKLHLRMGIARQLLQASNCCSIDVYRPYNGEYY